MLLKKRIIPAFAQRRYDRARRRLKTTDNMTGLNLENTIIRAANGVRLINEFDDRDGVVYEMH